MLKIAATSILVLAAVLPLASSGCGPSQEASGPAQIEGEAAGLQFGLAVELGEGTMLKPTETAIRDALINAGFRLGETKDADVTLELRLSDVDSPQIMRVVVNGVEQKKRKVTAVMRAVSADGDVISQKSHSFVIGDREELVEEEEVAPLVRHFAGDRKLEKYGIERAIDRAQRQVAEPKTTATEATADPAPTSAPPPENTSTVKEQ